MAHGSYAHLAPATLILGGAGTLFVTGSGEVDSPEGRALALLGGFAIWAVLAALWWVNMRSSRYTHWVERQWPKPAVRRGGFGLGALASLVVAFGLHWAAYAVATLPQGWAPEGLRGVATIWVFTGFLGYVVFPLVAGFLARVHQATRIS